MTSKPTVLFVCVHNAGRSQIAAGQGVGSVRPIRDAIGIQVEELITELEVD